MAAIKMFKGEDEISVQPHCVSTMEARGYSTASEPTAKPAKKKKRKPKPKPETTDE